MYIYIIYIYIYTHTHTHTHTHMHIYICIYIVCVRPSTLLQPLNPCKALAESYRSATVNRVWKRRNVTVMNAMVHVTVHVTVIKGTIMNVMVHVTVINATVHVTVHVTVILGQQRDLIDKVDVVVRVRDRAHVAFVLRPVCGVLVAAFGIER